MFIHGSDHHRGRVRQFGFTSLRANVQKGLMDRREDRGGVTRAFGVFTAQMRDLLQFVVIRHGFLYGLSVGDAIVRRPWKNLNAVDFVTDSYSRRYWSRL